MESRDLRRRHAGETWCASPRWHLVILRQQALQFSAPREGRGVSDFRCRNAASPSAIPCHASQHPVTCPADCISWLTKQLIVSPPVGGGEAAEDDAPE